MKKAGIFTLSTLISLLIIYFVIVGTIVQPSMGSGLLLFWFVIGWLFFNAAYYLTIFAYKKVMGR
jgi:hypothetical protein